MLKDINLTVEENEFVTFFGPNGCGKSTLMNIIAGLLSADSGKVTLSFEAEDNIAFVFQDYRQSLLPWHDVGHNIMFPLRLRGVPHASAEKKVEDLLGLVGIKLDLRSKVYNLSGGQSQLTCLLRALVIDPKLLILDEPFSALDYQARMALGQQLMEIWQRIGFTILLISHDIDEALYLGDKTVFLGRRPAEIVEVLPVPFKRPRQPVLYGDGEFAKLKKHALETFAQCVNSNSGSGLLNNEITETKRRQR